MSDDEPIRIEGVNVIEFFFLEMLWTIESTEALELWKATLSMRDLETVERLEYMIYLAVLDQEVDKKRDFPVVRKLLEKYML